MYKILINFNSLLIFYYVLMFNVSSISTHRSNNKLHFRRDSPKYLMINEKSLSGITSLNRVELKIKTFWGKESQFNSEIPVTVSLNDTFLNVKKLISSKTGIPVELQSLYLPLRNTPDSEHNSIILSKCVRLSDADSVMSCLRSCRIGSRALELELLLDLPAPAFKSSTPNPNRIGDYLTAVVRYNNLLTAGTVTHGNCADNINSFIKHAEVYNTKLGPTDSTNGTEGTGGTEDRGGTKGIKDEYVDKRVYVRICKDYPRSSNVLSERVGNLMKKYLPIDLGNTLKLSAFCLLLKLNSNFSKTALDLIGLVPLVSVFVQTRPGILCYKTLFHLIAQQYIPKLVYNILPAHLAEKVRVS
ncbi:Ubiquitin family protein [Theileria parva strain Muguga]|uniref:Ubiquitin-like domain-containing protein n=1 Tax=Theileria parva TaxID=5875 RepID=Q4N8Z9_THEPA|nr:Ubiquitin family protein [Theileria parva strain Muguga]EAN33559.1 Ubiquitin family protein [Theileria parva strain Muguga]|eukprot:XP_765842.1 hypothetical protein [Theileria parva strain Muguga]